MNRFFAIFNLLGVAVLAVLCALQWTSNGRLSRENQRLEMVRSQQAVDIDAMKTTIAGQKQDLDEFRGRLTTAEDQLKDCTFRLVEVTADRDQLKATLDQWMAAVKARDELLKQVAAQRNEAIEKFNELTGKYNSLVKKMNGG